SASSAFVTESGFICQLASISSQIRRLVALSSTTSARRFRKSIATGIAGCALLQIKPGGERKPAAAADLAVDRNTSAHQLDELRRDRQPQSGSAVTTSSGGIGLLEG